MELGAVFVCLFLMFSHLQAHSPGISMLYFFLWFLRASHAPALALDTGHTEKPLAQKEQTYTRSPPLPPLGLLPDPALTYTVSEALFISMGPLSLTPRIR